MRHSAGSVLMSAREVADRYANAKPGFRLLEVQEVALPHYWVKADAVVQERSELPPIERFVLRAVRSGLTTVAGVASILGLEQIMVNSAAAALMGFDYLDYSVHDQVGSRILRITSQGVSALDTLEHAPRRAQVQFGFDRILWQPVPYRFSDLVRPKRLSELDLEEIRPMRPSRPIVGDLAIDDCDRVMQAIRPATGPKVDLVALRSVTRAERRFLPAQLLIYGSEDSDDAAISIAIDGHVSEAHSETLAALGGARFLRLRTEPLANDGLEDPPVVPIPPDLADQIVPLVEVERIRTQTVRRVATQSSLESAIDGQTIPGLDDLPVRELDTFEHSLLFAEYQQTVRSRLLIISPWLSAAVLTRPFLENLEALARRGVSVSIGFGIDDGRDDKESAKRAEKNLVRAANRCSGFVVARFGNSHEKVLIADDRVIVGSFNWLSFKGDRNRTYRAERGILVAHNAYADQSFNYHRARILDQRVAGEEKPSNDLEVPF
jgi:hypothetical protein